MGALTGNTVQSTYLDLVQLGKSGAGLPSHAGKEAAIYDGSGAQILGRTAVRHWLDPHPAAAAFAETWEFSTTGDMTQGQLESAGWTFDSGMSGSVSGGVLKLTSNAAYLRGARLTVSYAGDFDILAYPLWDTQNTASTGLNNADPVLGVGASAGEGHHVKVSPGGVGQALVRVHSATTSDWSGGTSASTSSQAGPPFVCRICRTSGTVYISGSFVGASLFDNLDNRIPITGAGWWAVSTDVDAATMNTLFLGGSFPSGNPASIYWHCVRRFA